MRVPSVAKECVVVKFDSSRTVLCTERARGRRTNCCHTRKAGCAFPFSPFLPAFSSLFPHLLMRSGKERSFCPLPPFKTHTHTSRRGKKGIPSSCNYVRTVSDPTFWQVSIQKIHCIFFFGKGPTQVITIHHGERHTQL